jgi:hypothetical protein
MKHLYIIFFIGLLGCKTETKNVPSRRFDRYVFAFTYANNSIDNIDKKDLLGTICHRLIFLTKNNYCEVLSQYNDSVHFFKGYLKPNHADSLVKLIEGINSKYKNTFNPEPNCIPDMNIIVENDTSTTHKFVNYYDKTIYALVNDFETKNNLKKTDTIENLLKYRYYITTKVSLYVKLHYDIPSFNHRMLQLRDTSDMYMK